MLEITIEVNGIERNYKGSVDTLQAIDWTDVVNDMISSQVSEGRYQMPGFEESMEEFDKI